MTPASRRCARPGCDGAAVASMSYDYRHRSVWIDPLAPEPHPALYDLCERCAQRMSPPRSWVLTDRRDRQLFSAVS